jgi:hypothetical protein
VQFQEVPGSTPGLPIPFLHLWLLFPVGYEPQPTLLGPHCRAIQRPHCLLRSPQPSARCVTRSRALVARSSGISPSAHRLAVVGSSLSSSHRPDSIAPLAVAIASLRCCCCCCCPHHGHQHHRFSSFQRFYCFPRRLHASSTLSGRPRCTWLCLGRCPFLPGLQLVVLRLWSIPPHDSTLPALHRAPGHSS